jgi:hypothetical protein
MATTEEEQTLKRSQEICAQVDALIKEALDPKKQLDPLFDELERQAERMRDVLQTKGAPPGTGQACLEATMELISDFVDYEVLTFQATDGAGARKPAPSGTRPGMRRGMRI